MTSLEVVNVRRKLDSFFGQRHNERDRRVVIESPEISLVVL